MTFRPLTDAEETCLSLCLDSSGLERLLYTLSGLCDYRDQANLDDPRMVVGNDQDAIWRRRALALGEFARRIETEKEFQL